MNIWIMRTAMACSAAAGSSTSCASAKMLASVVLAICSTKTANNTDLLSK